MSRVSVIAGRHAELASLLRFGIVGVANTGVDFVVFLFLIKVAGLSSVVANTISYSLGVLNSFLLNKYWTFGARRQAMATGRQFVLFIALSGASLLLSDAIVALLKPFGAVVAKLVSVPIVFIWNYWTSRQFVYRERA